MNLRCLLLLVVVSMLVACATYTRVDSGVVRIDDLYVVARPGWSRAPSMPGSRYRMNAEVWTRDGETLNTLVFIPAVQDGESLITSLTPNKALPEFRSDMLPNDIVALAESTFVKVYGEGNAVLSTSNLRPQRFGEHQGFMFDVDARVTERPNYKGIVGAFIAGGRLYLMYYLAADPYYFDKDVADADAVIRSASLKQDRK